MMNGHSSASNRRSQSAMEYLMTYGWAILIIAIVLASLWSLGLFSSPVAGSGAACAGTVGYLCGTPVLESNGLLLTSIGQTASGSAITVTGLGCSNTSAQPSSFSSTSLTLPPSQSASVAFSCSLPSNAMGAPFTGTLWIQYNVGYSNRPNLAGRPGANKNNICRSANYGSVQHNHHKQRVVCFAHHGNNQLYNIRRRWRWRRGIPSRWIIWFCRQPRSKQHGQLPSIFRPSC